MAKAKKGTFKHAHIILHVLEQIDTRIETDGAFSEDAYSKGRQDHLLKKWAHTSRVDHPDLKYGKKHETPYQLEWLRTALYESVFREGNQKVQNLIGNEPESNRDIQHMCISELFRQGSPVLNAHYLAELTFRGEKNARELTTAMPDFDATPDATPKVARDKTISPEQPGGAGGDDDKDSDYEESKPSAAKASRRKSLPSRKHEEEQTRKLSKASTLKRKASSDHSANTQGGHPHRQPSKKVKSLKSATQQDVSSDAVQVVQDATEGKDSQDSARSTTQKSTQGGKASVGVPFALPVQPPSSDDIANSEPSDPEEPTEAAVSDSVKDILSKSLTGVIAYIDTCVTEATNAFFKEHTDPNSMCRLAHYASPPLANLYADVLCGSQDERDWKARVIDLQKQDILGHKPFLKALIWAFLHTHVFGKKDVSWEAPHSLLASDFEPFLRAALEDQGVMKSESVLRKASLNQLDDATFQVSILEPAACDLAQNLMLTLSLHREQMDQTLLPMYRSEKLMGNLENICQEALLLHAGLKIVPHPEKYSVQRFANCLFFQDTMKPDHEFGKHGDSVAFTTMPALVKQKYRGQGVSVHVISKARVILYPSEVEDDHVTPQAIADDQESVRALEDAGSKSPAVPGTGGTTNGQLASNDAGNKNPAIPGNGRMPHPGDKRSPEVRIQNKQNMPDVSGDECIPAGSNERASYKPAAKGTPEVASDGAMAPAEPKQASRKRGVDDEPGYEAPHVKRLRRHLGSRPSSNSNADDTDDDGLGTITMGPMLPRSELTAYLKNPAAKPGSLKLALPRKQSSLKRHVTEMDQTPSLETGKECEVRGRKEQDEGGNKAECGGGTAEKTPAQEETEFRNGPESAGGFEAADQVGDEEETSALTDLPEDMEDVQTEKGIVAPEASGEDGENA